jgi:hypothetical protein
VAGEVGKAGTLGERAAVKHNLLLELFGNISGEDTRRGGPETVPLKDGSDLFV